MTEPVGYIHSMKDGSTLLTTERRYTDNILGSTPLYSKSQLHPRVKMTQSEFDEFKNLISEYGFVLDALQAIYNGEYKNLYSKLFNGRTVESDNEQVKILTNLMFNFDPDNPEETIEIVPDMKWFVRAKKSIYGVYKFLDNTTSVDGHWYNSEKEDDPGLALPFDTKEEAEKWTNPLTEAVLLPMGVII